MTLQEALQADPETAEIRERDREYTEFMEHKSPNWVMYPSATDRHTLLGLLDKEREENVMLITVLSQIEGEAISASVRRLAKQALERYTMKGGTDGG